MEELVVGVKLFFDALMNALTRRALLPLTCWQWLVELSTPNSCCSTLPKRAARDAVGACGGVRGSAIEALGNGHNVLHKLVRIVWLDSKLTSAPIACHSTVARCTCTWQDPQPQWHPQHSWVGGGSVDPTSLPYRSSPEERGVPTLRHLLQWKIESGSTVEYPTGDACVLAPSPNACKL